jgi:hypothetical protein
MCVGTRPVDFNIFNFIILITSGKSNITKLQARNYIHPPIIYVISANIFDTLFPYILKLYSLLRLEVQFPEPNNST